MVSVVSKPKTDQTETYTYEDYLTWDGPERWELIDGVPYLLASPVPEHQQVAIQLGAEFAMYLRGKECRAFIAPMDLTFEENQQTNKVIQPDLFVMCGEYGSNKRITGIPALIVEILSPSTAKHDLIRKLNLYQKAGVKEYWVVDPEEKNINIYLHDGAVLRWTEQEYKPDDKLSPSMFPDLVIGVSVIFA